MKFYPLSFAMLLAIGTSCSSHSNSLEATVAVESDGGTIPVDPALVTGVLDNGLTYYILENREPEQRAVLRLALNAGSIQEDDDQLGLAHVVEHMAFNGTEHFASNDLIETLEEMGVKFGSHLNAHTSFDETVYKLTVPTDDKDLLDKGFLVLHDWAQGVLFDPEEVELERGVVLEEWRRGQGAGTRVRDQLIPVMFGDSKYPDRLPIGTEDSLKTFDRDALVRFYTDWYRADLLAVVAVGDFDAAEIEQQIITEFSDLTNPENPRERSFEPIPTQDDIDVIVATDTETPRTTIQYMIRMPGLKSTTYAGYRQDIINSMAMSILNERLTDISRKPDSPFIGAGGYASWLTPITRMIGFTVATTEDGVEPGLDGLMSEVYRAVQHGFTEAELKRAKDQTLSSMEAMLKEKANTSSTRHVNELVRVFLTGESVAGIEKEVEMYRQFLPEITTEDVNAATSVWAETKGRSMALVMPEKEGLFVPTGESLTELVDVVSSRDFEPPTTEAEAKPILAVLPEPGTVVSSDTIDELGVTRLTLSNGVRVWLKPTDFKDDEVLIKALSRGGMQGTPDDELVSAAVASSIMWRSGLGDLNASELQKVISSKKVRINSSIGGTIERVSGFASPDDLEVYFQMAYQAFMAPRFDADAAQVEHRNRANRLKNRLLSPESQHADAYTNLMWNKHIRKVSWTMDRLDEMDLKTSEKIYRERFADADDFEWFITGTFTVESITPLLTQYVATLPSLEGEELESDDGVRYITGKHEVVVNAGSEPKAQVTLEMHGPATFDRDHRFHMSALRQVLSTRLREVLREEMSGVYGVGVRGSLYRLQDPHYQVKVSFGCDPERVDELVEATFRVMQELKDGVPEERYIDIVKEQGHRDVETSLVTNGYWHSGLSTAWQRSEDPLFLLKGDELLDTLTAEHVHAAANEYLTLDDYRKVVLLPELMPEGEQ